MYTTLLNIPPIGVGTIFRLGGLTAHLTFANVVQDRKNLGYPQTFSHWF